MRIVRSGAMDSWSRSRKAQCISLDDLHLFVLGRFAAFGDDDTTTASISFCLKLWYQNGSESQGSRKATSFSFGPAKASDAHALAPC